MAAAQAGSTQSILTTCSQGKLFRGQKGGRKSSNAPEGLGYVDMGESFLMAVNMVSGLDHKRKAES